MTTTHNRWIGGATAVAQVQTIRFTTSEAGNTVTITLTAEDGSTQAVTHTVADTNNNTTASAVQSALASSSLSLFSRLTYTVSTDTVTITADLAGRPFKLAVSDNGNTAYTVATTTANAGPNDFGTAANWSLGSVPVDEAIVYFTEGSNDVLYGLIPDPTLQLDQFIVGPGYTGNIGTQTAPLKIDCNDGGEKGATFGGGGRYYNIEGNIENVFVTQNRGTLKLAKQFHKISIMGQNVGGKIVINATHTGNGGTEFVKIANVSRSCTIEIPSTSVYINDIYMDSGFVELSAATRPKSKAIVAGTGTMTVKESGKIDGSGTISTATSSAGTTHHTPATITVMGKGRYLHQSDQDLASGETHLAVFGGEADFTRVKSRSANELIDLGTVEVYGGVLRADGASTLVDLTSVTNVGGEVRLPSNATLAGFTKRSG